MVVTGVIHTHRTIALHAMAELGFSVDLEPNPLYLGLRACPSETRPYFPRFFKFTLIAFSILGFQPSLDPMFHFLQWHLTVHNMV